MLRIIWIYSARRGIISSSLNVHGAIGENFLWPDEFFFASTNRLGPAFMSLVTILVGLIFRNPIWSADGQPQYKVPSGEQGDKCCCVVRYQQADEEGWMSETVYIMNFVGAYENECSHCPLTFSMKRRQFLAIIRWDPCNPVAEQFLVLHDSLEEHAMRLTLINSLLLG